MAAAAGQMFLTRREAAGVLRLSIKSLDRLAAEGRIIAVRPMGPRGRKVLIDTGSVEVYAASLTAAAKKKAQ